MILFRHIKFNNYPERYNEALLQKSKLTLMKTTNL